MASVDDILSLLAPERRRYALYYLKNADGAVPIEELTEEIYAWEENDPENSVPTDEFRELLITLEHTHLPKIDEATHVEYDRTNDRIRITGMSSEADVLLSVTEAIEQPSETNDFVVDRLA
jgi:hypothetical protein